ncbi:hypothetical protein DC081_10835 [Ignatzschineria cameli]|uniref:Uncharacterized protein n=1 Tax=Ignatzschineria cameli TaxID=2182793 RepID=A0A2U2AJD1_9GAMM|nr:hypothetical protein DC077_10480 [Ignatzschineria cameli]PWD86798.1 hypothetical protein DC079_10605 [Ignatzschineria cameli]PWD88411.1 hypothetical protein DC081_10835 [Ignatzschineria cameli]PWD90040.1 hypothetical protein DC078_09020 [Ignatzschineria cameli]
MRILHTFLLFLFLLFWLFGVWCLVFGYFYNFLFLSYFYRASILFCYSFPIILTILTILNNPDDTDDPDLSPGFLLRPGALLLPLLFLLHLLLLLLL